jgi:mycothiol synthase
MKPTEQPDFILRSPTLDDIPATVKLLNACWIDRIGRAQYTIDHLREFWTQPEVDYRQNIRLAVDQAQIIGYCGVVSTGPDGHYDLMACTHPTRRGQGIGTALMQWAEARIAEHRSLIPADRAAVIRCRNFSTNVAGTQLLLDLGYQSVRRFYEMKIDMSSAPPPPVWPTGITVRSMIADQEEAAVYLANEEAFRDQLGDVDELLETRFPKWLEWVRSVPDYDPAFFFIAHEDDEIAGVALCFPKDPEFPDMGFLHALSVRRTWRRRGIATALLQHVFGACYGRGIHKVVLTVDTTNPTGATALYERAGMHVFMQWDTYQKELQL